MKTLHNYSIRFTRNGEIETQVRLFQAGNPGHAFTKCVRRFPGCILLAAWCEGRLITEGGNIGRLSYAPPSTVRIIAEPIPEAKQMVFGFFEELSCNPRNRNGATPSSGNQSVAPKEN
jgi:hypothetical protein